MDWKTLLPQRTARVSEVPLDRLRPNPAQPRRFFEEQAIAGLAASIEENGLL